MAQIGLKDDVFYVVKMGKHKQLVDTKMNAARERLRLEPKSFFKHSRFESFTWLWGVRLL